VGGMSRIGIFEPFTLGDERGDAIRHRGTPAAEVGHRRSQGIDQRIHIGQRLELHTIQNEHSGPPS